MDPVKAVTQSFVLITACLIGIEPMPHSFHKPDTHKAGRVKYQWQALREI